MPTFVLLDMVILVRLVPLNASFPIEVTLEGMVTLSRLLQKEKASCPIEVTLEGMVILVRPLYAKASSSIEVTPSDIVTLVRLVHQ